MTTPEPASNGEEIKPLSGQPAPDKAKTPKARADLKADMKAAAASAGGCGTVNAGTRRSYRN